MSRCVDENVHVHALYNYEQYRNEQCPWKQLNYKQRRCTCSCLLFIWQRLFVTSINLSSNTYNINIACLLLRPLKFWFNSIWSFSFFFLSFFLCFFFFILIIILFKKIMLFLLLLFCFACSFKWNKEVLGLTWQIKTADYRQA